MSYAERENIAYNCDCIAGMRLTPDKYYDLAIVDPPTGQNEGKKHATRPKGVVQKNGQVLLTKTVHKVKEWDNAAPTQEYFDELFRVSKHQIIMCENYLRFKQKDSSAGRIIWNLLRDNDFSSCQIMWTSLFQKIEYFEYMWNGMMQGITINSRVQFGNKALNQKRIHPSEKPLAVYRWLFKNYTEEGWKVLDTHLGGGMSRIAALEYHCDFHGYETDPDHFAGQLKRFKEMTSQQNLFRS